MAAVLAFYYIIALGSQLLYFVVIFLLLILPSGRMHLLHQQYLRLLFSSSWASEWMWTEV